MNVQSMAFGNMGLDCGTGVAFTRNPSTGERELYGEFLVNAQGEDVVAGIRTPMPIAKLKDELPGVYQQFVDTCMKLERHYRDMQDIEFTGKRQAVYAADPQWQTHRQSLGQSSRGHGQRGLISIEALCGLMPSRSTAVASPDRQQFQGSAHCNLPASQGSQQQGLVCADQAQSREAGEKWCWCAARP